MNSHTVVGLYFWTERPHICTVTPSPYEEGGGDLVNPVEGGGGLTLTDGTPVEVPPMWERITSVAHLADLAGGEWMRSIPL